MRAFAVYQKEKQELISLHFIYNIIINIIWIFVTCYCFYLFIDELKF